MPSVSKTQWQASPGWLRWLIATRASVLPLTLFGASFAACLQLPSTLEQWLLWLCCTFGLVFAHATNNLLNDYIDHTSGLDQNNYFRTRYGAHPLANNLMTRLEHRKYIVLTGSISLLTAMALSFLGDTRIALFALAGGMLVLFYTYPLKRIALGEIAVLAAWGPLMIGGVYLLIHAELPANVVWAGLIYGLGPTIVIFGKHTDKREDDLQRGIRTLPNLISAKLARRMIGYLAVVQMLGAVAVALIYDRLGLLAILAITPSLVRLLRVTSESAPMQKPQDYPEEAWPLWYTTHAFVYSRWTGLALIAGLTVENFFYIFG